MYEKDGHINTTDAPTYAIDEPSYDLSHLGNFLLGDYFHIFYFPELLLLLGLSGSLTGYIFDLRCTI